MTSQYSTPPRQLREQYYSLNGLRAYSAIGIALMHILSNIRNGKLTYESLNVLIGSFTNFVFLFFIISAFGMCCGYYERIKIGGITVNDFYKKRYKRIWPYFALLCLIGLAFDRTIGGLWQTFADLTLCFNLLPNPDIKIIGVGWFIGLIFLFYIMFPFFVFLIDNKRRAWIVLVIAIAFHFIGKYYFFKGPFVNFEVGRHNMIFSMPYFLAGGLIFLYRDKLKSFASSKSKIMLLICISLSLGYFIRFTYIDKDIYILILFSAWLMYAIGGTKHWLNNKVANYLSGISMEIYLSHMVLFRLVEKLSLDRLSNNPNINYIIAAVATLTFTICFCHVVKYIILPRFTSIINHLCRKLAINGKEVRAL